ncbi:hypothetical protein N2152v2_005387 [Parachlorella kessleri]
MERQAGFPDQRREEEEVAAAVKRKIAAAVETEQNYKQVLIYGVFVGAYMVALYLQASAYDTGEVVSTLRSLLLPEAGVQYTSTSSTDSGDPTTATTFYSNDEVLNYIEKRLVTPIWRDPQCGDSICDDPFEFPAFGRFGCRADCGAAPNTTHLLVRVSSNFAGHPLLSPRVLMAAASWNLCLLDTARRKRGDADLCWFEEDQTFSEVTATRLETVDVIDGRWYIYVHGDYAGRVSGAVFDLTDPDHPKQLALNPAWETCKMPRRSQLTTT